MNHFKEDETLPIEQLIRQLTEERFSKLRDNLQQNNSFIFLEKSSLDLLLTYLLSGGRNETPLIENEAFELKILEQLNEMMDNNEKEFKAIINFLKEIT